MGEKTAMRRGRGWAVLRVGLLVSLLISPLACKTGGAEGNDLTRVIERNKSRRPTWLRLPASALQVDDDQLRFIYVRRGLAELKLGLHHTAEQARLASEQAFYRYVLELLAKDKPALAQALSRAADSGPFLQVAAYHRQHTSVGDIYYERLIDRDTAGGASYDIHVLVQTQRQGFAEFLQALRHSLVPLAQTPN